MFENKRKKLKKQKEKVKKKDGTGKGNESSETIAVEIKGRNDIETIERECLEPSESVLVIEWRADENTRAPIRGATIQSRHCSAQV